VLICCAVMLFITCSGIVNAGFCQSFITVLNSSVNSAHAVNNVTQIKIYFMHLNDVVTTYVYSKTPLTCFILLVCCSVHV